MKTIDHTFTTIEKTVCPFCCYGCEFGIVIDDFGTRGVEYLKDGSSDGRLCPRGSAAVSYLNHSQRSYLPMKKGRETDWKGVYRELKRAVDKPEAFAITFDRNITKEEYKAIIDFSDAFNIKNMASSYLEPEALLKQCAPTSYSQDLVDKADLVLVIGDAFNIVPMISKALITWKMADRKHRFIVLDTMYTHTAGFATDFLKVTPGSEALALFALAQESLGKLDPFRIIGIDQNVVNSVSRLLKDASQSLIFTSMPFARTYDPSLFVEGVKKVAQFANCKVITLTEFPGFQGRSSFSSILSAVRKGKIKNWLNFGELFPFFYPQLAPDIKKVNIYASSPMKFNVHTILPGSLVLEKSGTVPTLFGDKTLNSPINAASGARSVIDILKGIKAFDSRGSTVEEPVFTVDIKSQSERVIDRIQTLKKKKALKIIGEKVAYQYLGFFDKGAIKVNPQDAEKLGVKPADLAVIASKHGKIDLPVRITRDIDPGYAVVPVELPEVRGLFDYEIENDHIVFIPTEVEVWRKG